MRLGRQASECDNVALVEVCGSTVEKGGVAGAEFSADGTFSQWFCSLINVCSSLQSLLCLFERNKPCSPQYRGIWAICMHKMMFPSESCNSVLNSTFREFRPFSVIVDIFSPQGYAKWFRGYAGRKLYPSLGTDDVVHGHKNVAVSLVGGRKRAQNTHTHTHTHTHLHTPTIKHMP